MEQNNENDNVEGLVIKPCPFCGGEGKLRDYHLLEWWRVTCEDCEGQAEYFTYNESKPQEQAIAAWNKRVL